jgi:hypothetical protein
MPIQWFQPAAKCDNLTRSIRGAERLSLRSVQHGMSNDPNQPDEQQKPKSEKDVSPAGPHDRPELTDDQKTPGSGMLPDDATTEIEGPSG